MSERPEEAIRWLERVFEFGLSSGYDHERKDWAARLIAYIARLEAELKVARADSERLEELELALKEGDVCHVTASDRIESWQGGKYKYIEIEFDSDRNPVSRESLAEAIDEALEEPNHD